MPPRTRLVFALASSTLIAALIGCSPPPPAVSTGPPPPPPVPAPAPKPPPPPPKPEPDPYETAVNEIGKIVTRYNAVYAEVKDEASGDKALVEIARLTSRLQELSGQIAKMPYRPGQEKHTLALQTELTKLPTAQLTNEAMQRVFADPDLQLKFLTAHQRFVLEGIGAIGPAIMSRQQGSPQPADQPATPAGQATPKN